MISVAMCTYNGAKFLPEQLESIANQIVPVDELVVCDDGSNDDTLEVLKNFGKTSAFPVFIHSNEKNLGSTKNFEKCFSLCNGDIIFLSDQDDLWRKDKVEKHLAYYQQHPQMDAVFSDAMMIDDDSKPTNRTIWQEIEFNDVLQDKWIKGLGHEILFYSFVVTGATLSIRKSALKRLTPFPTHIPELIHDAWIAMVLCLQEKIGFVADTLIYYRIHNGQQVGFGRKVEYVSMKDRMSRDRNEKLLPLAERADNLEKLYVQLREVPLVPREKLIKLYLAQKHFKKRATLPENRLLRISPVMNDIVRGYYTFSSKDWWLPAIGDIVE
jgi:glycosyltransferase involved in cell wall biosynthesis